MEFVPSEKGVPIRQPSTANLMIDSADRTTGNPANFVIVKKNSILNGFFTRIGATEVVLNWFQPNISAYPNEDTLVITVGSGSPTTYTAPPANYTQAELIDWVVAQLDTETSGITWTVESGFGIGSGIVALVPSGNVTLSLSGSIAKLLDITATSESYSTVAGIPIGTSDLRPYSYIDFVSSDLTYNQALKDASTANIVRDVLVRWYFAFDQPPTLDKYGFPILMGYTAFCLRRTYSPPKQIRWESNMPLGNLAFQLYDPSGNLVEMDAASSWGMTLQVSEV